ncbi:hypothetical protein C1646_668624 [Rhizophagus diaphanus]|nr:hypothetical protein C1646_668624 [Rhizophagus diaphanus] [Rhizophagus sp. MUCL 43196]
MQNQMTSPIMIEDDDDNQSNSIDNRTSENQTNSNDEICATNTQDNLKNQSNANSGDDTNVQKRGNVNKLKKEIQNELYNKLSNFDIDEIALRHGKESLLADITIDKKLIMSYDEPIYVEVTNTGLGRRNTLFARTAIDLDLNKQVIILPPLPGTKSETRIYKHRCYNYFKEIILKSKKYKRFCITGNPGTGKTFFRRYIMSVLLKKGFELLVDDASYPHIYLITRVEMNAFDVKWVRNEDYGVVTGKDNVWCIINGKPPKIITHNELNAGKTFLTCSLEKHKKSSRREELELKLPQLTTKNCYTIDDIEDGKYCKPVVKNFETIDAIYIGKDYNFTFQITVERTHDIKQHGYELLHEKLGDTFENFQKQPFTVKKEEKGQSKNVVNVKQWIAKRIEQYVLLLDIGVKSTD